MHTHSQPAICLNSAVSWPWPSSWRLGFGSMVVTGWREMMKTIQSAASLHWSPVLWQECVRCHIIDSIWLWHYRSVYGMLPSRISSVMMGHIIYTHKVACCYFHSVVTWQECTVCFLLASVEALRLHCIGHLRQECGRCHIIDSVWLRHYRSVYGIATLSHQFSYDGTYYTHIRLHAVIFIQLWRGRSVRYASFLHRFSCDGCIVYEVSCYFYSIMTWQECMICLLTSVVLWQQCMRRRIVSI